MYNTSPPRGGRGLPIVSSPRYDMTCPYKNMGVIILTVTNILLILVYLNILSAL